MVSATTLIVLLGVATILGSQVNAALMPSMCSDQEKDVLPCMCCKKSCWFGISEEVEVGLQMTSNYFGNMPGERNDAEAKFAIAMMRDCVKFECLGACSYH
ncbi:hypothetical protein CAEBREN_23460 [Caenorhabditis brenneri]|uniref:Uncharacterized protein n=1 Tax=Caenorhabditis brenneri TaxID=135651 RepID=G0N4G6_CAEBE|nr:hypothetical protein CAEBREN_23460 [Caenorhabditis brenneri]